MNAETAVSQQMMPAQRFWDRLFVLTFSAALFCSALLMFSIQPLIGKLLLPKLGGSPQVWNTCMVFFQAMLFAGYLHAHYTGKWFGSRAQAGIHLVLVLATLLSLPIGLSGTVAEPDVSHPVLWLMQTLFLSVGAPMFVISSTAPLLQKWFSHTDHPSAQDPYFLYAASNLGSLLALVSYPTLVEPLLDHSQQTRLVSAGFIVLVVAQIICAFLFFRHYSPLQPDLRASTLITPIETITWPRRLRWLLLSFAPSSLLLGVTTYVTTDIASVPLFWIAPLALYLTTFVLVFARRQLIPHNRAVRIQSILVTILAIVITSHPATNVSWPMLMFHTLAFFLTALACHGELVSSRPAATHLTEFYLWLSLGGVLGGAFNALLAPLVFSQPFEYPLALALASILCAPPTHSAPGTKRRRVLVMLLLLVIMLFNQAGDIRIASYVWMPMAVAWGIVVFASLRLIPIGQFSVRTRLAIAAALLIALFVPGVGQLGLSNEVGPVSRTFFGVYKAYYHPKLDANLLENGTTLHGAQSRNPALAMQLSSYYYTGGPFGQAFQALGDKLRHGKVAVVGLGTGTIACYGTKDSVWTYYEIDPIVEKIARDTRYFTYLRDCPAKTNVIIGDARLKLRDAPDHYYNLIVVDAFSSDSIPTHLLTREALAGYLRKLTSDGVLMLHLSNRYMNLEPVVGNLARDAAIAGRINRDIYGDKSSVKGLYTSPAWLALLARHGEDFGAIAEDTRWRPLISRPESRVWSDDYVNVLSVIFRSLPAN